MLKGQVYENVKLIRCILIEYVCLINNGLKMFLMCGSCWIGRQRRRSNQQNHRSGKKNEKRGRETRSLSYLTRDTGPDQHAITGAHHARQHHQQRRVLQSTSPCGTSVCVHVLRVTLCRCCAWTGHPRANRSVLQLADRLDCDCGRQRGAVSRVFVCGGAIVGAQRQRSRRHVVL